MIEVSPKGCVIDRVSYPPVGFGTYRLTGDTCYRAVLSAYEAGYRIIDTATYYTNFEPIGRALKKIGRENVHLISKVWPDSHTPPLLKKDLQQTLKELQTDYLDTYFLHWPNSKVPLSETLAALQQMKTQIRHIGMSNVTINHLKRALEFKVPIDWVQVEFSPYYYDPELLAFCHRHKIAVQAWAPLGAGKITGDERLAEIGQKHQKTASQVALRWILQQGVLSLPGSQNPEHIRDNFHILDFTLSEKEVKEISDRAKKGKRYRVPFDEFDYTYDQCWPQIKNDIKW